MCVILLHAILLDGQDAFHDHIDVPHSTLFMVVPNPAPHLTELMTNVSVSLVHLTRISLCCSNLGGSMQFAAGRNMSDMDGLRLNAGAWSIPISNMLLQSLSSYTG